MNSTHTGSAGQYPRKKSPNGTGVSRYKATFGPGDTNGFYAFLNAKVAAGEMTAGEKQKRIWASVGNGDGYAS